MSMYWLHTGKNHLNAHICNSCTLLLYIYQNISLKEASKLRIWVVMLYSDIKQKMSINILWK